MSGKNGDLRRLKYAQGEVQKSADSLNFSEVSLAERHARHCASPAEGELGPPLTIRDVARILGCSAWTIRQQLLPRGLPHFRVSPAGRLVFFHNQIVRWVLDTQRQKGGIIR